MTNFAVGNEFTYTGRLKNGISDGFGKWTKTDGSWYEGEFKDGNENGKGTLRDTDGKRYFGNFTDGVPNGVFQVKQWTLGGLISNEWYAEYKKGQLVNSEMTKNDFDRLFYSSGSSSAKTTNSQASENRTSSSESSNTKQVKLVEIIISNSGKACCSYRTQSYCFDIYEDDKKLGGQKIISRSGDGPWFTDCNDLASWKVSSNSNYREALKDYYRKKYNQEPGEFMIH